MLHAHTHPLEPARRVRGAGPTRTRKHPGPRRANRTHGRRRERVLASYRDRAGRTRELLACDGAAGSLLVVDRLAGSRGDRRLLAHLAPDEPRENAALVCAEYLQSVRKGPCRCRALALADLCALPDLNERTRAADGHAGAAGSAAELPSDRLGRHYRLATVPAAGSPSQLRWSRERAHPSAPYALNCASASSEHVSLREAIASLESYEPIRALTERAIALAARDATVSTTVLRAELVRVRRSPIILNRALREAVLERVGRGELSMSEIAIRCGRVKRDCHGNESGETSWLARRLGMLPEGGQTRPTPWVHSDVLGLIARSGLGIAPREVEL
jgi:hypothetical protein